MIAPSLFPDDPPAPGAASTPAASAAPAVATAPTGSQTRSLYRKYRPATFAEDELVGQEVIVRTLRNAIARDRLGHAYLFCGPRGTGKTTTARLLAKAVNCLDPDPAARPCGVCANCVAIAANATTDVVEIDAASNRGIDDIRELRERVKYAPTHLRTKFYIIDEAHQITGAAANAFLKTLEEPPGHTKFVLATTDPEELLQTIVSRCQRFDFRRIGLEPMVARLATVARAEGLTITEEALQAVARAGTGSLRDAIGLLDQLAVYEATPDPAAGPGAAPGGPSPEITVEAVRALLGISRNDRIEEMAEALAAHDARRALVAVNQAVEAGEDPRQLNRQFVAYLRILLHERAGGSPDADDRAREIAKLFSLADLAAHARLFSEADQRIRHAPIAHLPLELALVDAVLYGQGAAVAGPAATVIPTTATPRARPGQGTGAGETMAAGAPGGRPADDTSAAPATVAVDRDPGAGSPPQATRPPGPSLRDRVRGAPVPAAGPAPEALSAVASVPARSIRETPATASDEGGPVEADRTGPAAGPAAIPEAASSGAVAAGGAVSVETLVELWPRIRLDVKAKNRRIEALLSSIDPVAIEGGQVTLVAAYDFHRNRLNSDEVRVIVEDVISALIRQTVQVTCVMRGDVVIPAATPSAARAQPAVRRPAPEEPRAARETTIEPGYDGGPTPAPGVPGETDHPDAAAMAAPEIPWSGEAAMAEDDRRIAAIKNVFDAEEIPNGAG